MCVRLWLSCNVYVPVFFQTVSVHRLVIGLLVLQRVEEFSLDSESTMLHCNCEGSIWLAYMCCRVFAQRIRSMFDIKCITIRFQTVARNSILRFQRLRHRNSHYRFVVVIVAVVVGSTDRTNDTSSMFSLKIEIRVLLNNIKSISGKVSESKRFECMSMCVRVVTLKSNTKNTQQLNWVEKSKWNCFSKSVCRSCLTMWCCCLFFYEISPYC